MKDDIRKCGKCVWIGRNLYDVYIISAAKIKYDISNRFTDLTPCWIHLNKMNMTEKFPEIGQGEQKRFFMKYTSSPFIKNIKINKTFDAYESSNDIGVSEIFMDKKNIYLYEG